MNESSRWKISKKIYLNYTLEQTNLTNPYRTSHPTTVGYTFFSTAHGTISKTDHMLSHKTSLNKFSRIEII
jgi:hypothetical protein